MCGRSCRSYLPPQSNRCVVASGKARGNAAVKVRASVKKRSREDQIVRRKGRVYIINKRNPRNKQRQG